MHDLTDDDRARLELIASVCDNRARWAERPNHRESIESDATFLRKLAEQSPGDQGLRDRALLERVSQAVKATAKALIVVEPKLREAYEDDPRWSPWTRFFERTPDSPWPLLCKADTELRVALTDSTDNQQED